MYKYLLCSDIINYIISYLKIECHSCKLLLNYESQIYVMIKQDKYYYCDINCFNSV